MLCRILTFAWSFGAPQEAHVPQQLAKGRIHMDTPQDNLDRPTAYKPCAYPGINSSKPCVHPAENQPAQPRANPVNQPLHAPATFRSCQPHQVGSSASASAHTAPRGDACRCSIPKCPHGARPLRTVAATHPRWHPCLSPLSCSECRALPRLFSDPWENAVFGPM